MKKPAFNFNLDWKSKFVDLFIVIIGITIAFKLNNWNESRKTEQKEVEYLESFYNENQENRENLISALNFSKATKKNIDSLKQILSSGSYADESIKPLIASMMALADYSPSITTMENITASGEFELINDIELRKSIINTYNTYETTTKLEGLMTDYVNDYVTPYFMENFRFSNFGFIHADLTKDPLFENIVLGYDAMLVQQIGGYERNLDKQNLLHEKLSAANSAPRKQFN